MHWQVMHSDEAMHIDHEEEVGLEKYLNEERFSDIHRLTTNTITDY